MSDGQRENTNLDFGSEEIDIYFDKTKLHQKKEEEKKSCTLKGITDDIKDVDESQISLSLQRLEESGEI